MLMPQVSVAKTYVNQLAKPVWYKYGVNPWSKDTDNDGFSDVWEIQSGYCPTFPGILPITDVQCQKGVIDLNRQTYTPPKNVSFFPARPIMKVASCQAFEKVLTRTPQAFLSLDAVTPMVSTYGADDPVLVRSDNRAAYVLTGQVVRVVSVGSDAKLLATIKLSTDNNFRPDRIYLQGTTLIAVGSVITPSRSNVETSRLEVWDVKDLAAPERQRTLEISGSVIATHVSDGSLYVALSPTSYSNELQAIDGQPTLKSLLKGLWFYRDLRSRVAITPATQWKTLSSCDDIEYASPVRGQGIVELVAVSFKYPSSALASKTLFGMSAGSGLYFAGNNVYVVSPDFNYSWLATTAEERTELYRLNLTKNRFTWAGSQTVPGTIVPGALDEYQGKIRIATTKRRSPLATEQNNFINSIYVLDSDLTRLVWSEGFAPYERMIDVTFAGPQMYIQTDHSENGIMVFGHGDYFTPKQLGRLSSPGSLLMKPLSNGFAFTLGHNTTVMSLASSTTSTVVSTSTPLVSTTAYAGFGGVKLGLINATMPENSFEFPMVIGDRGSETDALRTDSLLALDAAKKYVAFPMVEVLWNGLRVPTNTAYSLIRNIPFNPQISPLTTTGVYVFALNHDSGPEYLGSVSIPDHDAQQTPSPTLGVFFRNGMLYTATADRMIVSSLPTLSTQKEIVW